MLHEISKYAMDTEANFYDEDIEADRRILQTMEEFFTKDKRKSSVSRERLGA
jgi:hypothetical protein